MQSSSTCGVILFYGLGVVIDPNGVLNFPRSFSTWITMHDAVEDLSGTQSRVTRVTFESVSSESPLKRDA